MTTSQRDTNLPNSFCMKHSNRQILYRMQRQLSVVYRTIGSYSFWCTSRNRRESSSMVSLTGSFPVQETCSWILDFMLIIYQRDEAFITPTDYLSFTQPFVSTSRRLRQKSSMSISCSYEVHTSAILFELVPFRACSVIMKRFTYPYNKAVCETMDWWFIRVLLSLAGCFCLVGSFRLLYRFHW